MKEKIEKITRIIEEIEKKSKDGYIITISYKKRIQEIADELQDILEEIEKELIECPF